VVALSLVLLYETWVGHWWCGVMVWFITVLVMGLKDQKGLLFVDGKEQCRSAEERDRGING
jgi:hypothetical protein